MRKLSRRKALSSAAVLSGTLIDTQANHAHAWSPGPDKNLERNLIPGKTAFRLGTDLKKLPGESATQMVSRLKRNGQTGVFAYKSRWWPESNSEMKELLTALKENDVKVFEVGGYVNMLHPDTSTRQKFLKRLAVCIEEAEQLNCPMVGTISGSCDDHPYGINVHPDNWTKWTWKRLVDGVRQVLKDTSGSEVVLGMEAQVTTNLDGPIAHKRLMDDVGDKRCAVNLDPVNMVSLANYYHTTELIEECFDMLGETIYGCHAKDSYIWPDKQTVHVQEVCPGRGVVDYETYLACISRMKWPRTLKVEHIPDEQYPEANNYIRKIAAKVGVKVLT